MSEWKYAGYLYLCKRTFIKWSFCLFFPFVAGFPEPTHTYLITTVHTSPSYIHAHVPVIL